MATIPAVPAFTTGQTPSIATLNQLASCVTFIYSIPAFAQLTNTGQALANGTLTAVSWAKTTDRDSGWSSSHPTRYTAQTGGYYQLDALISFSTSSSTGLRQAYYQVTTGSNNPGGAGNTTVFGTAAGTAAASPCSVTIAVLSPYLYVDDYVEIYAYQNSGGSLNTAASTWEVTLESLGP